MGGGLSKYQIEEMPDLLDEFACKVDEQFPFRDFPTRYKSSAFCTLFVYIQRLADEGKGLVFDEEAFNLLKNRGGYVRKRHILEWSEPLSHDERNYFADMLGCSTRLEFLKKYRPVVKDERSFGEVKFMGALKAMQTAKGMLKAHKLVPQAVRAWATMKGFDLANVRGAATMANGDRLMTPLAEAAAEGRLDVVKWLHSHGAAEDACR
jgi:hypothetical protein